MKNYNLTLQSNNLDLQTILNTINSLPEAGGGTVVDDVSKAIIAKTITSIEDDSLETVGFYAFAYCYDLTSVNFPACTSIGSNAFANCYSLTSANFPACTSIGSYVFASCFNLTSVNFPACTSIGSNAFYSCFNLLTANFSACTSIDRYAFAGCGSLTSVSFPACTSISHNAFGYCSGLTTVSFPACTNIGYDAFDCCFNLTSVNFPVCTSIGPDVFYYCRKLSSLQLGASSVCTLNASDAFSSTPFAGYSSYFSGTPHIYVPSSLITTYQSATNWVYYSSYFSSIESLEKELITFTIDGVEYQAENGMTWGEWVESEYNTHPTLGIIANNAVGCTECGAEISAVINGGEMTDDGWFKGSDVIGAYGEDGYSLNHSCDIITFTIGGTTYQAVEGMTWAEWVESEYNTNNYFVDGEYVYGGIINGMPYQDVLYEYAGSRITVNDTIIADHHYFTSDMMPL